VCQYLIGISKFWPPAVHDLLASWRRCRQAGVAIVLVEGNRDFFLDEPQLAPHIDHSSRRVEFVAGAARFRLEHGDLVNRRDLQYRFWAWVSKSALARFWAHLLPRPLAVAIVNHMEARLARTNRKYRLIKPIAELERGAREAWAEGVDVMLWGHFHSGWKYGEDGRVAMVVPGWLETRQAMLVAADGQWSVVDGELERASEPAIEDHRPAGDGGTAG
jgi:UDP-2,3-diacylglucosamine pyrophosphatase LpxH